MKKKMIITISSIAVVAVATLSVVLINGSNKSAVLEETAFRTCEAIENEETTYFDDEAIALAADSSSDTSLRSQALRAYNLVNEQRAMAGAGSLTWDPSLESTSNVRALEASQSFSHTRPDGSPWYTVNSAIMGGENLAYGFNDAESAMAAWMASPTHADNVLYDGFTRMAISVYSADNGTCYWAQEYGY